MNINESPDPRLSLWASTAFYLRFFRQQHGHSGDHVAGLLKRSRSSISRLESGESQLKDREAELLDQEWNTGGLLSLLLFYARLGHDPNWFRNYRDFEKRATVIRMYDGQLVPALLQTLEYARALLISGRIKNPDKAAEDRISRQEIMQRTDPPELWVLLAETVLGPAVGGKAVMRAQLSRMLELSELPNIILRIVPNSAGANEGLDGPFKVITVKEGDVGFIEAPIGGRLELDASQVEALRYRFDRIGSMALPVDSSRVLIQQAMETM